MGLLMKIYSEVSNALQNGVFRKHWEIKTLKKFKIITFCSGNYNVKWYSVISFYSMANHTIYNCTWLAAIGAGRTPTGRTPTGRTF